MRHERYERLLPDLVANTLHGAERAELEGHLEECAECAEWHRTYGTLAGAVDRTRRRLASRHPSSDDLAHYAVAAEALEPQARGELEEHLARCADCRSDLALAERAVEGARQPAERKVGSESRGYPRWSLAAAAALLLAVAGVLLLARPAPPPETVHLPRRSIDATSTFEASKDVVAEEVALESGAVVRLRAGETVSFGEGFSVGHDAEMIVEVSPAKTPDTATLERAQT